MNESQLPLDGKQTPVAILRGLNVCGTHTGGVGVGGVFAAMFKVRVDVEEFAEGNLSGDAFEVCHFVGLRPDSIIGDTLIAVGFVSLPCEVSG